MKSSSSFWFHLEKWEKKNANWLVCICRVVCLINWTVENIETCGYLRFIRKNLIDSIFYECLYFVSLLIAPSNHFRLAWLVSFCLFICFFLKKLYLLLAYPLTWMSEINWNIRVPKKNQQQQQQRNNNWNISQREENEFFNFNFSSIIYLSEFQCMLGLICIAFKQWTPRMYYM